MSPQKSQKLRVRLGIVSRIAAIGFNEKDITEVQGTCVW